MDCRRSKTPEEVAERGGCSGNGRVAPLKTSAALSAANERNSRLRAPFTALTGRRWAGRRRQPYYITVSNSVSSIAVAFTLILIEIELKKSEQAGGCDCWKKLAMLTTRPATLAAHVGGGRKSDAVTAVGGFGKCTRFILGDGWI